MIQIHPIPTTLAWIAIAGLFLSLIVVNVIVAANGSRILRQTAAYEQAIFRLLWAALFFTSVEVGGMYVLLNAITSK